MIIEEGIRNDPVVIKILKALPGLSPEYIKNEEIDFSCLNHDTLALCRNKGRFLKPCPGTKEYLCCLYQFLNIGLNCPIDCTYCILQVYLNTNALVVYVNYDDLLSELGSEIMKNPSIIRIGTGELTDSLALDPLTGISLVLIDFFSRQRQAYLELKTKSDHIGDIIDLDHQGQTIMSWSLNPQNVICNEEGLAASLNDRIKAARRCQERGYKTGFHFDPILLYKEWEADYESVIETLFRNVDFRFITWISMGCFRFIPELKPVIQKRFPKSLIVYEEFIPGLDKKMRYPQPVRINIYSKMALWIRKRWPDAFIYLCMESPEVWKASIGYAPDDNLTLKSWLDERCRIR
ncbi:DNA photolyase [bacterium]|nr:DNA photolyase [bacterium]